MVSKKLQTLGFRSAYFLCVVATMNKWRDKIIKLIICAVYCAAFSRQLTQSQKTYRDGSSFQLFISIVESLHTTVLLELRAIGLVVSVDCLIWYCTLSLTVSIGPD